MEISQGLRLCYKRFYNYMLLKFYPSAVMQRKVIAISTLFFSHHIVYVELV